MSSPRPPVDRAQVSEPVGERSDDSPRSSGGRGVRARRPGRLRAAWVPYVLVAPVALFILLLAVGPSLFTVVEAFFRVNPLEPPTRFDGLGNFRRLLDDPAVRTSIANTGIYVVVGTVASTVLGIAAAVVLQRPFWGRSVVIAVMILPWALPGVVEGILWTGIFDANAGLVNGLAQTTHLGDGSAVLLGHGRLQTIGLIELVQVWQITPLSALLVLAGLQIIPGELYEAALMDGCGPWSAFRRITLPLIRPAVAVAMVQAVIATLNVFDQPFVLNGASNTGSSVMMQTYFISFQDLDFGEGYALSLLVTVVTLVLSLAVVAGVYRKVEL